MPWTTPEIVTVVAAAAAFLAFALWWTRLSRRWRRGALRREYLRRLHLPPSLAADTLARQLERVAAKFPGRTEAWYLRFLMEELSRDRR